jgi:lysophospholipase L1-like esterase
MKIKKIICFGDSITGTCVTGYNEYNGLKFYPYLLGEHFDCEIENYGQGNNSNEKIGIDILDVLHRENIDDSFFVINWTSAIRRLVYMEDRDSLANIGDATESRPWYKSSLIDSYATLKTMIMVQSLLDKMNIPYLNFFGWKSDFYLDNFSINWIGKHYIKYGKSIEWDPGSGERKIDSVNLYNYKSNMWSNAIPASPKLDSQSSEKHTFDFIYYLTNHLNMESFIHTEFYNFLVNKGTKRGTFSPIFKKNIKIPVLNDKILVISDEDLHPNELGHKLWTEEMLIPHIEERLVL